MCVFNLDLYKIMVSDDKDDGNVFKLEELVKVKARSSDTFKLYKFGVGSLRRWDLWALLYSWGSSSAYI